MSLLRPYLLERSASPPSPCPSASSGGISFAAGSDCIDVVPGRVERRSRFSSRRRGGDGGEAGSDGSSARKAKSSASLLSCIDDALRSLDQAIVAEERAEQQQHQVQTLAVVDTVDDWIGRPSRPRSTRVQTLDASAQWLCSSIGAFALERKRIAMTQWHRAVVSMRGTSESPAEVFGRMPLERSWSSHFARGERQYVQGAEPRASARPNCCGESSAGHGSDSSETPSRAQPGLPHRLHGSPGDSRHSPLRDRSFSAERLSVAESECDFLRRALAKERMIYVAFSRVALRARQAKMHAWRRLRLQANAARALETVPLRRPRSASDGFASMDGESVTGLVRALRRVVLRHQTWAWRRLLEFNACVAGRACVVRSLACQQDKQSLQEAFREAFGKRGVDALMARGGDLPVKVRTPGPAGRKTLFDSMSSY